MSDDRLERIRSAEAALTKTEIDVAECSMRLKALKQALKSRQKSLREVIEKIDQTDLFAGKTEAKKAKKAKKT